jgi:hypothetical protein
MAVPYHKISSIQQIAHYNKSKGQHFFDPSTMRFFNSVLYPNIINRNGLICFVTSEAEPSMGIARKFTARALLQNGHVEDLGEFQQFETEADAREYIMKIDNASCDAFLRRGVENE